MYDMKNDSNFQIVLSHLKLFNSRIHLNLLVLDFPSYIGDDHHQKKRVIK